MSDISNNIRAVSNKPKTDLTPPGMKPLSHNKTIKFLGVDIPVRWFEHPLEVTLDKVLEIRSADARTTIIQELYYGGTIGFYADLIKSGKGAVVLESQGPEDYSPGRIWEIDYNEVTNKYLEVINQTPEPGSQYMTEEQRLNAGLTREGYKTVLLGIDPRHEYKTIWEAVLWTTGITGYLHLADYLEAEMGWENLDRSNWREYYVES